MSVPGKILNHIADELNDGQMRALLLAIFTDPSTNLSAYVAVRAYPSPQLTLSTKSPEARTIVQRLGVGYAAPDGLTVFHGNRLVRVFLNCFAECGPAEAQFVEELRRVLCD